MITKEQEEEFKRRKAAGPVVSEAEFEEFNRTGVKFSKSDYLKFLKSTDEKCK